jgi:membrane-associated phospholipid phosphatase
MRVGTTLEGRPGKFGRVVRFLRALPCMDIQKSLGNPSWNYLAVVLLLLSCAGLLQPALAQDSTASSDPKPNLEVPATDPAVAIVASPNITRERPVSWLWLVPNVALDQKPIWTFPISVARGHHLKPALIVTAITAGLVLAVDPPSGRYFQRTHTYDGFNLKFDGYNTAHATLGAPVGLYALGLARRDAYLKRTFLMAGEAVLDAEIVTSVMKDIDRRLKPIEVPMNGNFNDTWLHNTQDGSIVGGIGSFPSGHTIAAFSVATVFADRYPRYKYLAYGLAALVGFSRVSIQSHHPSDVFAATALGYSIAHYVVIHSHARN